MAIACLRLVTFLPDRPLRSVPAFRSCMAFSTLALLALLYFVAIILPFNLNETMQPRRPRVGRVQGAAAIVSFVQR